MSEALNSNFKGLEDDRLLRVLQKTDERLQRGMCAFEAGITNAQEFGKVRGLADIFRIALQRSLDEERVAVDMPSFLAGIKNYNPDSLLTLTRPGWTMKDASCQFNGVAIGDYRSPRGGYMDYSFNSTMRDNRDALVTALRDALTPFIPTQEVAAEDLEFAQHSEQDAPELCIQTFCDL